MNMLLMPFAYIPGKNFVSEPKALGSPVPIYSALSMFSVILDLNGYVYDYISLRGKTEYLILQALDSNKNDTGKKKKRFKSQLHHLHPV